MTPDQAVELIQMTQVIAYLFSAFLGFMAA